LPRWLSLTDAEFAAALDRGSTGSEIFQQTSSLRIVVRDAAGSVRLIAPENRADDKLAADQ
jgi:hypothetical protein